MSQNLLEKILQDDFNYYTKELIDFLMLYKKNDFIYPSAIKNKFSFDDKTIYNLLSILETNQIVKMYYEVFCYNCDRSMKIYERFNEIEEIAICDMCENSMYYDTNLRIVYKVVI